MDVIAKSTASRAVPFPVNAGGDGAPVALLAPEPKILAEPWHKLTVAGLCSGAAAAHPDRLFMADCPDKPAWAGLEPRRLNFGEFYKRAQFFGAQLQTLGITAGERVMLLLPNSVEAAISVVGCLCAGFVPAPAPLDEAVEGLRAAAERMQVAAIITMERVEGLALAEKARQVAARVMSVRCVAGFGLDLPVGVVSLEGWSEEDVIPARQGSARKQSSDALVSFARENGGICGYIRSEAQLIADALALAAQTRIERGEPVIQLLQPASAASLVAGVLLPLFLGTSVHLVGPYQSRRFSTVLDHIRSGFLLAPQHFIAKILDQALPGTALSGCLALMRPEDKALTTKGALPLTTLFDLNEQGLLASKGAVASVVSLAGVHPHPMEGVLVDEAPLITVQIAVDGMVQASGFGAPRVIRRGDERRGG